MYDVRQIDLPFVIKGKQYLWINETITSLCENSAVTKSDIISLS